MSDTTEAQEQERAQETEQEQEQKQAEPTPQEVEARKMGWRPKEEWDDDGSAQWLDADAFNERNTRLADRGDKILKAEINSLTRKMNSMERTLGEAAEHIKKATALGYKKALKEIEAKADKAVEEGDTDAYHRAKGEMQELEQEVKAETKVETKPVPKDDPDFDGWLSDNVWYDPKDDAYDVEMASYADSIVGSVGRTGLQGRGLYDRMTAEMKKKFPDRFGNQRRRQAPAVEGAGAGGGSNGKTLWSQVPKEARAEFKRFVGQGLYKDDKEGQEKYAEIYTNG